MTVTVHSRYATDSPLFLTDTIYLYTSQRLIFILEAIIVADKVTLGTLCGWLAKLGSSQHQLIGYRYGTHMGNWNSRDIASLIMNRMNGSYIPANQIIRSNLMLVCNQVKKKIMPSATGILTTGTQYFFTQQTTIKTTQTCSSEYSIILITYFNPSMDKSSHAQ